MVWDFAIVYLGISLAIAGWNLGLRNSWPAPIAMVLSTAITQLLYVNFSTWIVDQARLPTDLSFFIGYLSVWLVTEAALELGLVLLLPLRRQFLIGRANRIAGSLFGFAKAYTVVLFATAASVSAMWCPLPPDIPAAAVWLADSSRDSVLMHASRQTASKMPSAVAQRIISQDAPSYKITFETPDSVPIDEERAAKWRSMFRALQEIDKELSQL